MSKPLNLIGQKFGRLTVLSQVTPISGQSVWLCRCDCGTERKVRGERLKRGATQSCGCLRNERVRAALTTHGMRHHPLYGIWHHMVERCYNPADASYPNYGARGITICNEWRFSFENFYNHVIDLPNCRDDGYSLDRRDNSLGYFPGNVRWATRGEQSRNRRTNVLLTYNGKTQTVLDWAEELDISAIMIYKRLYRGWDTARALTTPRDNRGGSHT